ncbi:MAG: hypothetical protein M0R40_10425 [Firmicutes bacterium]|nr:hypothetical protein [Bacillota bacterium]
MRIDTLGKITPISVPGVIFGAAITGAFVELTNYQQVTFIVASGEGDTGETTITVEGKFGSSGTAAAIPFMYAVTGDAGFEEKTAAGTTFTIGGASGKSKYAIITVTDTMLAKAGYDRVCVKTTKVTSSTVPGAIYAVQTKPRYLE